MNFSPKAKQISLALAILVAACCGLHGVAHAAPEDTATAACGICLGALHLPVEADTAYHCPHNGHNLKPPCASQAPQEAQFLYVAPRRGPPCHVLLARHLS